MTDHRPRPLLPVLAALLVLGPASAAAQRATTSELALDPFKVGALVGFESGDDSTGFALRLDGEKDLVRLGEPLSIAGVLSFGYARFSDEIDAAGVQIDSAANVYKLIPAARLRLDAAERLEFYGDVGLGLYHARTDVDTNLPGFDEDSNDTGFALRLGVGGRYDLTDVLALAAEFNWNKYYNDFDTDTLGALFGLVLKL